jgi:hypothetical protein
MGDLHKQTTAMPETEFTSLQLRGSASQPLPVASRRLCPYCRSMETARSHRRGPFEKYLLRAIHVRVYRCDDCDSRFYAFSHDAATPSPKKPAA